MNGDLISREVLLKEVRENKELYEKERVYIEGLLLNAPTVKYPFYAEAYQTGYEEGKNARKQGELINVFDRFSCPFCKMSIKDEVHYLYSKEYRFNYCPNCGAKLRLLSEV